MSGQGQTDPHWSTHHVPVQPEEHADIYFRLEFPFAQVLIIKIGGLIFLFIQARLVDKMFFMACFPPSFLFFTVFFFSSVAGKIVPTSRWQAKINQASQFHNVFVSR